MNESQPKVVRIHCNTCRTSTEHVVRHCIDNSTSEDVGGGHSVDFLDYAKLVQCLGCKSVSMEHVTGCSEDWDADDGINWKREYFPPRTYRLPPDWLEGGDVPSAQAEMMREIYVAVQNGLPRLAVMGIRSLLETVMQDKVNDQGSFAATLRVFSDRGHISQSQRDILDAALQAGHATIHRQYVPNDDVVITCMDVAEHVLQSVHVLPKTTKSLLRSVPKRGVRGKKAKKAAGAR
jgi:hypothetical protein